MRTLILIFISGCLNAQMLGFSSSDTFCIVRQSDSIIIAEVLPGEEANIPASTVIMPFTEDDLKTLYPYYKREDND